MRRLPAVADERFLSAIGDRSVGGVVARDQMVGPWQVPVADVAVTATSYDVYTGEAMAIGERAPVAVLNPAASARLASESTHIESEAGGHHLHVVDAGSVVGVEVVGDEHGSCVGELAGEVGLQQPSDAAARQPRLVVTRQRAHASTPRR